MLAIALCVDIEARPESAMSQPGDPCLLGGFIYSGGAGITRIRSSTAAQWTASRALATYEPVCTPAAIVAGSSSGLHAFHPTTGRVLWSRITESEVYSPVIKGQDVYAADKAGYLRMYQLRSGRLVWKRKLVGWLYPPALVGRVLATGGNAGVLYGLDAASGRSLWNYEADQELVYRPQAVGRLGFAVTTYAGTVSLISRAGIEVWKTPTRGTPYTPLYRAGRLYVGTMGGFVYALDARTGRILWRYQGREPIRATPGFGKSNRIWISGARGSLFALHKTTGALLLRLRTAAPITTTALEYGGRVFFRHGESQLSARRLYAQARVNGRKSGR